MQSFIAQFPILFTYSWVPHISVFFFPHRPAAEAFTHGRAASPAWRRARPGGAASPARRRRSPTAERPRSRRRRSPARPRSRRCLRATEPARRPSRPFSRPMKLAWFLNGSFILVSRFWKRYRARVVGMKRIPSLSSSFHAKRSDLLMWHPNKCA